MLNVLDLFSGIGGFSLGLESTGHYKTVAFCEIEPFCQKVLRKHWPDVPIYGDIKELDGNQFRDIDLVSAGVPCQPASCAGKRRGTSDDRWLWGEAFRIIREVHPTWCIFENVRGLLTLEHGLVFEKLLSDLEGEGYEVQPFIIPACGLNAPHRRDRVWIIAHHKCTERRPIEQGHNKPTRETIWQPIKNSDSDAPDTETGKSWESSKPEGREDISGGSWQEPWLTVATRFCRMDDGIPNRVDRLKSLGNSVVPQIVAILGEAIWESQNKFGKEKVRETSKHP